MKKWLLYILALFYTSCKGGPNPKDDLGNQQALIEIRKEAKVKEALLTDVNVLYISVVDDGTNRSGLAEYLCQILAENKASCKWVKIVAFGTANKETGYGKLLGEAKRR